MLLAVLVRSPRQLRGQARRTPGVAPGNVRAACRVARRQPV